jgi:vacuolar-type H+-ATPase subunit I/STV1
MKYQTISCDLICLELLLWFQSTASKLCLEFLCQKLLWDRESTVHITLLTCGVIFYLAGSWYDLDDTVNTVIFTLISIMSCGLWILYPIIIFDTKIPNIIWTLYSGITGVIQDILSHMRLFGISLSGAILASVVNEISCLFPLYIQIPFCIILHIAIFLMSLLSSYVHTNRLIFYEFGSKCINGGQHYYSPLCLSSIFFIIFIIEV